MGFRTQLIRLCFLERLKTPVTRFVSRGHVWESVARTSELRTGGTGGYGCQSLRVDSICLGVAPGVGFSLPPAFMHTLICGLDWRLGLKPGFFKTKWGSSPYSLGRSLGQYVECMHLWKYGGSLNKNGMSSRSAMNRRSLVWLPVSIHG